MKINYREYSVEEFTQDEFFRRWVIENEPNSTLFWQAWLQENPDRTENLMVAKSFLENLGGNVRTLSATELEQVKVRVLGDSGVYGVDRFPRWRIVAVAASIVLLGLMWWFMSPSSKPSPVIEIAKEAQDIFEGKGCIEKENSSAQVSVFNLEDGSEVTLYPQSKLCIPSRFAADKREVKLQGKALFKVQPFHNQAFWVHSASVSAQVLGTQFLIEAFSQASKTIVEVQQGKVSVFSRRAMLQARQKEQAPLNGTEVTPNQEAVYWHEKDAMSKALVANPVALMPIAPNEFKFDDAPLKNVFERLEKIYGMEVVYNAKVMKDCYVTADLTQETLYEKLDLITQLIRAQYKVVETKVMIQGNGCAVAP